MSQTWTRSPERKLIQNSSRVPAGLGGIALSDLEREALIQTLKICNGNKAETARRLGVTEKSVYNKLKRHGLM